jgi:arginyl-tRNA synthetase
MPPSPENFDPVPALAERFTAAIAAAFPDAVDADPMITATKHAGLGDFQSNAAMPLAKRLSKKPREIASAIVARLDLGDIAEPVSEASIAGPGFINVRLRGEALARLIAAIDTPELGIARPAETQTIIVDLMGVNLAKQMHVGHLRSPFIGDAIARTMERLGHRVIRQNHVGDWGLPIAMVTARIMAEVKSGARDLARITLDDLDTAYKLAQLECQRDMAGLEAVRKYGLGPKAEAELDAQVSGATEAFTRARQTLVKLQAHDPETFALWQRISDVTMAECVRVCRRIHVKVTERDSAGESSYAGELPAMVADLESRGIAEESDGALVVRLEEPRYGAIREPCLIRKSDGGYLYATTDIAAVRRRVQKLHGDRAIYAIDARQSLHMRQVFGASRKAGYATNPVTGREAVLEHAAFGAILGEDGRPFKTRSGENVKLADLLDETAARALDAVRRRSPDLPEAEATTIAEAVGMAALKYADLCNDRIKDYVFSFDRMLAFEGNTGPYLLYALVRVRSIFRKAADRGVDAGWKTAPLRIAEPAEKALALAILRYPGAVRSVADSLEPHRLCQYLYDLAGAFSTFFDACPVLQAPDDATRLSRLRLCDLTARALEDGLGVLGIPTLQRM